MKLGQFTIKQLVFIFVAGIAGLMGSKLAYDNTEKFIKDDKIRKIIMPVALIALAAYLIKNKKYVQESIGMATGAVIYLAGALLDYFERSKAKAEFLGLAGDGSIEIPLNNAQEAIDFAVASQQLQGELAGAGYTEIEDLPLQIGESSSLSGDLEEDYALSGNSEGLM